MIKLTYKKHPRSTGLAGIGEGDYVDVFSFYDLQVIQGDA